MIYLNHLQNDCEITINNAFLVLKKRNMVLFKILQSCESNSKIFKNDFNTK